jgi:hypothetical protein
MVEHVALMRHEEMHSTIWSENLKGRDHLGDLEVGRIMILQWILKE